MLLVITVASSAALAACLPAPPPPSTPSAPVTAPPTTAPTTTAPAPGPSSGTISGACAAHTPAGAAESIALDADALTPSQAARAARSSARETLGDPDIPGDPGDVPVVVTSIDADGRPTVTTLETSGPTDAASKARALATDVSSEGGEVIAVEPDVAVSVGEPSATEGEPDTNVAAVANDPRRSSQWAFDVVTFESAWTTSRGEGTCVAVLDTGIQTNHPDLVGRIAGTLSLADDSVEDGHGHGTHVADILAANADNGIGVAGAAPAVDLLIVKVLGNNGSGTSSRTANGIIWAVDHGAQVVNLSLGSTCPVAAPAGCNSAAMSTAIDYAAAHDVIVVAAAGNDGTPGDPEHNWVSWPAALGWPIAVASIDQWKNRSTFSTQGTYVDVAAPGSSILSTAPTWATTAWPSGTTGYGGMSGTSMATPYVAALAGILRSAHPAETATQIRARVTDTVDDLGAIGWDSSFGLGLIDPVGALAG